MKNLDDTSARILQAAGPIFAKNGYQGTTVRDICSQAEVNLAAINYHFGDKESLYIATVRLAHQNQTEKYPLPAWSEQTPTAIKLHDFILTLLSRMVGGEESERWQTELIFRELTQPSAACESLGAEYFRPNMESLLAILGGVLPAKTLAHERLQIAFSIIGQCLFYRATMHSISIIVPSEDQQQHFRIEQLANHITQFSLAALGLDDQSDSTAPEQTLSQQDVTRNEL